MNQYKFIFLKQKTTYSTRNISYNSVFTQAFYQACLGLIQKAEKKNLRSKNDSTAKKMDAVKLNIWFKIGAPQK